MDFAVTAPGHLRWWEQVLKWLRHLNPADFACDLQACWGFSEQGQYFRLAIQNGRAYAWGEDEYGELGNNTTTYAVLAPTAVNFLSSGVTAIAGGNLHSLAIRNGGVYAWGWNAYGQLGNPFTWIGSRADEPVDAHAQCAGAESATTRRCIKPVCKMTDN